MPIRVFTDEQRDEIKIKMFEAGFELIKMYGMTHTSVVKITDEVGIGKSTFYNFFASKEVFVIELIHYERSKMMDYFQMLLNGRDKLTVSEAKKFLKLIILHQDSIYQYLTKEDMDCLYPEMEKRGMIDEDLNSNTPEFLFSHFENINSKADTRIFVNFFRIMAIAASHKEVLHKETLNETFDMMFDTIFGYIFKKE